ncbi:MAG TPA: hypothetical protein VMS32_02530 [Verrucomicrobiae bacterium]|jgi:hypothetical protein|nr:hypothetical protein [Verrucomicrobiae bacterium]
MRQRIFFVAALMAAGGIAACSSGGTEPSPVTGGSGAILTSNGVVIALGAAWSIGFPTVGGITGTIGVPAGTGKLAIGTTTGTPGGTIQLQSLTQNAAARTPIFYVTITARGPVTLDTLPGFAVTLATAPTASLYEGESVQNGGYTYWETLGAALAVSGSTVTVPAIGGSVSLADGQSIYLSVYAGGVIPTPAPRPGTLGNTFTFMGTLTNTATYTYPSAIPSPGALASMPPTTGTAQVTTAIAVQASPTPFFPVTASVVDVRSVETDAFALRSNVSTTDAWFGTSPRAYSLYGSSVNDGSGDTFATQYLTPQTVDQLPEAAATWTNSPAATLVETDADGTNSVRTIAADGTYTDSQTIPLGLTANIDVYADGSGGYGGTAFEAFGGFAGLFFGAPVSNVVSIFAVLHAPIAIKVATPTAFFSPAPVLYSESDVLTNDVAFSSNTSCAVPSQFGVTGNQIVQTISRIDPVLGYTEAETITTYDQPGIGPVCIVMFDSQNYYYNYNNDDGTLTSFANVFGDGSLKSVLTSGEVLNLQSTTAIVPTSVARSAQSAAQSQALAPSTIAYARAQFDGRLQKRRHQLAEALRTSITRVLNHSGVKQ